VISINLPVIESGPTKHQTAPYCTGAKNRGRNWPYSPAYRLPRYTIPEVVWSNNSALTPCTAEGWNYTQL